MSSLPLQPRTVALLGLMASLSVGPLGCENNSDTLSSDNAGDSIDFVITPSGVPLGLDETSATFTVQGGDVPLVWTVSDPALGTITDTDGRIANYSRKGTSQGVNEVRVTDAVGRTAAAAVVQDDAVDGGPLQVRPGSRTIRTADGVVTLQAIGGVPPYTWSVIDASLGSLSNTSQSFVNYRRNGDAAGVNVVELKDSRNVTTPAVIDQPALPVP